MKLSIKVKSLLFLCVLFTLLCVLLGFFSIKELSGISEKLVGEQAYSIVKTFNYQIDGDEFRASSGNMAEHENYIAEMNKLMSSVRKKTGCNYLYAMSKVTDDKYMYVLSDDGGSGEKEDVSDYDTVFMYAMDRGESGYTGIEEDPIYGDMLSAVVPIKDSKNKVVGILACDFLATAVAQKIFYIKIVIIVLSIVMITVTCILTYFAIRRLFKRLSIIVEATNEVAKGNLNVRIDDKNQDEFGRLSFNFNQMISKLHILVSDIKKMSIVIDENATNLSATSEEACAAANAAGVSIENISESISSQAKELELVEDFVHSFGKDMSQMSRNVVEIADNAGKVSRKSVEGTTAILRLSDSAESVGSAFETVKNQIIDLGLNIRKISEMSALIQNIASQTNLMALNASIEAARAGEGGRGFSVVASQIKDLSDLTKKSADEIVQKVDWISAVASRAIDGFQSLDSSIDKQMQTSKESLEVFKSIIKQVDEIIPQIDQISEKVLLLNRKKDDVISRIQASSEISKEIESSSVEIHLSSQEIHSASEEVASSAEVLNSLTNNIIKKVDTFQL